MSRPSSAVAASHRINMPAPNPPPRRPGRSTENVGPPGGGGEDQESQGGAGEVLVAETVGVFET